MILAAVACFQTDRVNAWKETGGGDEVGIEFRHAFEQALVELTKANSIAGAYNTTAYEYIGAAIDDLKNDTESSTGSNSDREATQNQDHIKLYVQTDTTKNSLAMIEVECFLD